MIYETVRALLKLQHKRIGDLERYVNVSPGYFSRGTKHGRIDFSLSKAKKVAEFFGISIDNLADDNFVEEVKTQAFQNEINELRTLIEEKQKQLDELERRTVCTF